MDVDLLNLTTEAQMELMNMMVHMEKLAAPDEYEYPQQQTPSPPPPPPPSASSFASGPSPLLISHPHPSIPFNLLGTTSQDPYNNSFALDPAAGLHCHNSASVEAMREMIFRIAAMQPVHIDPESVKPPKRRNVKISKDPQSVAARHRRERISERIRILQRLVPGGTKMDTASMLDEAIHYVKFLKTQVQSLERAAASNGRTAMPPSAGLGFSSGTGNTSNYSCFGNGNHAYTNVELS